MGRPEDSRVKIPAILHLTRLGYTYLSIKDLVSGVDYDGDTNIFYRQFCDALNSINDAELDITQAKKIIEEIKIKLFNDDLGKAFFQILQGEINGYRVIDFSNPEKNILNVTTELPYENGEDSFRPDVIALINGMPLSFIEVKRQNNRDGILAERDRMMRRFSQKIYRRFANITQFTVFSNNNEYDDTDIEPIQGAFYASSSYEKMFFSKFREERTEELIKGIAELDEEVENFVLKDNNLQAIKGTPEYISSIEIDTPTNRIITSLYSPKRLLFLLRYGICYRETTDKDGIKNIEKHIMRYPQFFATLAIRDKLDRGVKKGVIWHTQGSGKTALAYSNVKYLRDYFQSQGKIAKFYFVVDRIDLAKQAKDEFESRGLKVVTVSSKKQFSDSISEVGEQDNSGETAITVVNIQKFSSESITKPSDYNVSVQRVYFLDEAHRSYNPKGSFLANLMASDRDAIMIALTGTPLIGKTARNEFGIGFNTKEIFGDYIHKYYYNQSIADGYTLKLIREEIETTYRTQMADTLAQLEVQIGSIDKRELYAHPKFVKDMVKYIVEDYQRGKRILDDSIGAMIVCDTSKQAREIDEQLKDYEGITHALVLHDEGTKLEREDIQKDFKKGNIDILVVYNMLLTGFDAPRLKKQYLARTIKDHNLLQTLTRVNRPYKDFHYGFVVDFANIKDEFDKTNKAYFDELQEELGDELKHYSDLFKSQEEIEEDLVNIKNQLFLYNTDNVVAFINQISGIDDKKQLLDLRSALESYKTLQNLVKMFGYDELLEKLDISKALQLYAEVNNRLAIINLKQSIENAEDMSGVLNMALDQIEFQFRKVDEEELVIADAFRSQLEKTRHEIIDRCLDQKDPEYGTLLEELKRLFKKKNIEELTSDEMKEMMDELEELRKRAEKRNREDQMLAEKYGGDVKYMRTHKRLRDNPPPIGNDVIIHDVLMFIKAHADTVIEKNENVLDNQPYFIKQLTPFVMEACAEYNVTPNKEQVQFIDNCISHEYFTERNYVA